jgi:hypothetical protein
MGGVTRDVSDVSATNAQVRQLPFAEAFELSDGLAVCEPSLNPSENKRHQHGRGCLSDGSNGVMADSL